MFSNCKSKFHFLSEIYCMYRLQMLKSCHMVKGELLLTIYIIERSQLHGTE